MFALFPYADKLSSAKEGDVIVNVTCSVCMRYGKYNEGIMLAPEWRSPEGIFTIPEG